ncbi:MAG: hypothetical protein KQH63_02110 [Desulfobulbaceae bacterium]|nr:hypothetical protein [Desulfobulbaceae bacterium]
MKLKQVLRLAAISIFFLNMGMLCPHAETLANESDASSRCDSITLENAAAFLLVPAADLQKRSSDVMVSPEDMQKKIYKAPPYSCIISSKSNFLKSINYVTYEYSDPGKARAEFNTMQQNFGTVSKVDVVPGIGDTTFHVADNRFQRMVAIKGNVVIDVLNPKDFEIQKQIMQQILKGLR